MWLGGDATNADEKDAVKRAATNYRRITYLIGTPLGVLAFVLSLFLDGPSGQAHPFDAVALPLMSVLMSLLTLAFWHFKNLTRQFEAVLFCSLGVFFLSKLVYISSHPQIVSPVDELAEFGWWFPALYTLAFWMFGARLGRKIALGYYGAILLSGAVFLMPLVSDGSHPKVLYIFCQMYLSNITVILILSTFAGLTERQARVATDMALLANTDMLTKLSNRRALRDKLEAEVERSGRYNRTFALVLLDIDHFKRINDTLGHAVGDSVLQEMATLLSESVRDIDQLGRWGGEEFLLVLPELNLEDALQTAHRLKDKVAAHRFTGANRVTASFGLSVFSPSDEVEVLTKRADDALYRAKASGRNAVAYEVNKGAELKPVIYK